MKVLSLFDGISCGMVALERADIYVERYVAYEIEQDAITVSKHNYPQIEHCGDVFEAKYTENEFDLLIGGSPCTYWSVAKGGQQDREVKASGLGWDLFSQYVRALREVKPKWFLYENNYSMSEEIKNCISNELGVQPVYINSSDFSAQNRERLYWTNIPIKEWTKSTLVFADIQDEIGDFHCRSIEKYAGTIKWSKDKTTVSWDTSGKGWYSQQNRARKVDCKFAAVPAMRPSSKNNIWLGNNTIRLITVSEMEKLQTLPVGYTKCLVSSDSMGRCIGNGWTVDVIAHIFKGLKGE